MTIKEALQWRYSTKKFDTSKRISDADFEQIKTLLQLSPSSVNLQPWHFIIADSAAGKARVAKGAQDFFSFNASKITDASHVIIFCTRLDADETYMQHLLTQEEHDGRYAAAEHKEMMANGRATFTNIHRNDLQDLSHWMEKQTYLNMGGLLLGAAALGIDAVPMEGVDIQALNKEFNLPEKGFTATGVVSLGYRSTEDFNANLPKSRLSQTEIFTVL